MRRGGIVLDCDWSDSEIAQLIAAYADTSKPVALAALAEALGRNKANVCRKARALGLTNQRRAKVMEKQAKPQNKYATAEERNAANSARTKAYIAANGHPRGALGMKHTDETKKKVSEKARASWANPNSGHNDPATRQVRSNNMMARIVAGDMRSGYTRSRGGKRDDLGGIYFRSAWEANYARYLNLLVKQGEIAGWAFEPKTFEFDRIKRGIRAYTPDFRVDQLCGGHVWHEVKGWMDAKSKTRLARFARYFPDEKLIVVDSKWFKSANRTLAGLIPGWERGTVHS